MKSITEISKEDFIKRFVDPVAEKMTANLPPEQAEKCQVNVKVIGKTGRAVDFRAILIEAEVPNE